MGEHCSQACVTGEGAHRRVCCYHGLEETGVTVGFKCLFCAFLEFQYVLSVLLLYFPWLQIYFQYPQCSHHKYFLLRIDTFI